MIYKRRRRRREKDELVESMGESFHIRLPRSRSHTCTQTDICMYMDQWPMQINWNEEKLGAYVRIEKKKKYFSIPFYSRVGREPNRLPHSPQSG